MTREEISKLSDLDLVGELKKKLKKKPVIKLTEYFSDPVTDPFFEEIYYRYRKPIMSYCSKIIFDKDVLNDIFHEIFINIYLNLHRFKYAKSFKAWIYKIAHNVSINYIKEQHHNEKLILNKKIDKSSFSSDEIIELVIRDENEVENRIIKDELQKKMGEAFEKLPIDLKAIYMLRKELDMNFDEVAEIIGLTPRQIKSKYKRLILFIRSELLKSDITPRDLD